MKSETLMDLWLQSKRIQVKKSTLSRYYTLIEKHMIPSFGNIEIEVLTENEQFFVAYAKEKERSLSRKSLQDLLIMIKSIFDFAYERGYLQHRIPICIPSSRYQEVETLSKEEQRKLETHLLNSTDKISKGILFALCTGIRIGELCALSVNDLNLDRGYAKVQKTVQRIKNLEDSDSKTIVSVDTPKSAKSIRQVPLPGFLKDSFASLDGGYILTGTDAPLEPRCLQYKFARILKILGIPHYKFHVLRHTFSTNALRNGMDIRTLSELLGHSSVKFTLDRYCHADFETTKEEIEKLSKHLEKRTSINKSGFTA